MNTPPTSKDESRPFQLRVVDWMMETFSMEVCRDTTERNHRFLEESLELVQAMGGTAAEAHMLVDYVFGRPVGEPEQEVGGVMVTLAALCAAADFSMVSCGDTELSRCWKNIERIRAKQAGKPKHSPLPGPSVETPRESWCGDSVNLNGVDWVCTKPADHCDHDRHPQSPVKTSASHEPWCETLQVRSCNCSVENDPHSDLPVETT